MTKAVRYDRFGGIDVLRVEDVERPVPADHEVLVRVAAAGINPSESVIRTGALAEMFPSTFPSGQGTDLLDDPGKVAALPRGECRGEHLRQSTCPNDRLAGVDTGRRHPDEDLVVRRYRAFDVLDP